MSDKKQLGTSGEERDQRGRFAPGHVGIGGRPKGSRHKLADGFFRDFESDWAENGVDVIAKVRKERPWDYLATAARLMPREHLVELTNHEEALVALEGDDDAESITAGDPPSLPALQGDTGSAKGTP